ncbi:ankyrin repeat-containing protein [Tanacetum coccineum]
MAEVNGMISLHPTHEVEPEPSHSQSQASEPSQSLPQAHEQEQEQELPQAPAQTEYVITLAEEQELPQAPTQTESEITLVEEQELPQAPAKTESEITLVEEQETVASTQFILPLQDIFINDDRRTHFINICIPLYEASIKGDWNAALVILRPPDQDFSRHLVKCSITDNCETMLHVTTSAQRVNFVKNLVARMKKEDLQYQNKSGNTSLCLAAITGNIDIATIMVAKN